MLRIGCAGGSDQRLDWKPAPDTSYAVIATAAARANDSAVYRNSERALRFVSVAGYSATGQLDRSGAERRR